jgi:ubiquinone/menaquinone biosynthesis C-methylase UbiE
LSPVPFDALADEARAGVADLLDIQLSPLGLHAIDALSPKPGDAILDVGCGAGQSVLQLADRVGAQGRITGVDIAPEVLKVARHRALGRSNTTFVQCDAARLALPEGSFDAVFSRFGVMGFEDPVTAFANVRRMMRPAGCLAFVCWRRLEENELDLLPLQAASLAARCDPAPFSLSDDRIIRATLKDAGFRKIKIVGHDELVSSGDLETMMAVLLRVGPLGKIIRDQQDMRPTAESRLRVALLRRGDPRAVALNAAIWVVTARS